MPFETQVDMVQILLATLSVLEHSEYKGKDSKAIANLKQCLRLAIREFKALTQTPDGHRPDA